MERFTCPDHGRLVAELFLGRLDDAEATLAERALADCETCAAWGQATSEAAMAALEGAVAEGFGDFRAPRRAAGRWWLSAAAAAAVVTVAVGAAWWKTTANVAPTPTPSLSAAVAPPSDVTLTRWTFEEGSTEVVEAAAAPTQPRHALPRPAPAVDHPSPLRTGGFESGDLSGWSSHT